MTKAPNSLQDLQRRRYTKAKAEPSWRFWGLYVHVCKMETLHAAYRRAKANNGAPGSDGVTFEAIEASGVDAFLQQIRDELVTSTYQPMRLRHKAIPKDGGSKVRVLSIPTIRDRVVQGALKLLLEPIFQADVQPGSYGYRPKRSAQDAVRRVADAIVKYKTRVIDIDLQAYFDNLDHELVMRAVWHHTQARWILLYVERGLKAPVQREDGSLEERTKGSPQGAVIRPLLSHRFMHYACDEWLRRHYPAIPFARYADDAVIHAQSLAQAQQVLGAVRKRLLQGGLELHSAKTRIVYCKDSDRTGTHDPITFDFLGYTFAPRRAKNRWGKYCISFLPAVSQKAANSMRATMRSWRLGATRNNQSLEEIAQFVNPYVRGWVNYSGFSV